MSRATKEIRSFVWDEYQDDPQNKRTLFVNTDLDKVLTLYYEDTGYMITAPFEP